MCGCAGELALCADAEVLTVNSQYPAGANIGHSPTQIACGAMGKAALVTVQYPVQNLLVAESDVAVARVFGDQVWNLEFSGHTPEFLGKAGAPFLWAAS